MAATYILGVEPEVKPSREVRPAAYGLDTSTRILRCAGGGGRISRTAQGLSNAEILPGLCVSEDRPPSFQFYPRDFVADTFHLSDQHFRYYVMGLCRSWLSGCYGVGTPEEWREWMGIPESEWAAAMPALCHRFYITPTEPVFWVQKRMCDERSKQISYSEAQAERAKRGWAKRKKKMPAHSRGNAGQCSASASASKRDRKKRKTPEPVRTISAEARSKASVRFGLSLETVNVIADRIEMEFDHRGYSNAPAALLTWCKNERERSKKNTPQETRKTGTDDLLDWNPRV